MITLIHSANKKNKILFSIAILFFCSLQTLWAKPVPSLKIEMSWSSPPAVNETSTIELTIFSYISSDQLNFKIDLPANVRIVSGDVSAVLPIEKGEPKQLTIDVFIEEQAVGEIRTEIYIGSKESAYFSAADSLSINPSSSSSVMKSRVRTEPTYRRTEREGVGLREYRL